MVQNRAILILRQSSSIAYDLSIGATFSDLGRPLTRILKSHQYSALDHQ